MISKRTTWVVRILTAFVILAFAMSGIMKVSHVSAVVQGFAHAGIPEGAILPLGILELTCLALYLIPRTAVLGTFLLTGYLGGAILSTIITRMNLTLPIVVGLCVWAGAWLRVAELRRLMPLRQAVDSGAGDKLSKTQAASAN